MAFYNRNKSQLSMYTYDEDKRESFAQRFVKFPVFVTVALVLVVLIVLSIFIVNYSNNPLRMFVKASSKNFDSGSFEYTVTAYLDDNPQMVYDGQLEFDLDSQTLKSVYTAAYTDYGYEAAVYSKGAQAYRGSYYEGKWNVTDYTDRALDFFDFYRDYRKGEFDAGAAVRFTQTNDKFNAPALDKAVDKIVSELTTPSSMNNILHQNIVTMGDGSTVVTFAPELERVTDIFVEHIGSAYSSANAYGEFKDLMNTNRDKLISADTMVSYTINSDGYLSNMYLEHSVNGNTYLIEVKMSNFGQTKAQIPDGFCTAAGIEIAD